MAVNKADTVHSIFGPFALTHSNCENFREKQSRTQSRALLREEKLRPRQIMLDFASENGLAPKKKPEEVFSSREKAMAQVPPTAERTPGQTKPMGFIRKS